MLANFALYCLYVCLRNYVSCRLRLAIGLVAYWALTLPYILRAIRLAIIFNQQQDTQDCCCLFEHLSDKFMVLYLALFLIPSIVLGTLQIRDQHVFELTTNYLGECSPDSDHQARFLIRVFWISINTLLALVFVCMIYALRKVWDEFSIRKELSAMAFFEIAFLVLHGVSLIVDINDRFYVMEIFISVRCFLLFWVSCSLPLFQSFGFRFIRVPRSVGGLDSLSNILNDPEYFRLFEEFMLKDPDLRLLEVLKMV